MWNHLHLLCPIEDVCEYTVDDGLILQDLPNLISILTSATEVLTDDSPVWKEISIFQNVQAKYKRILHCDKSLLCLQKIGSCLRKMVLLNLSRSYLDLAEHLLAGMQPREGKILLPSRQQLEYVLIRTQSVAKLIYEALLYSRETFCFLIQRLKVGHLILNLMMATSATARLNILFKGLLVQTCNIYKKLYPWLKKLKSGTSEWPKILELPEDLEKWVMPTETDALEDTNIPKEQLDFLNDYFKKQKKNQSDAKLTNTKADNVESDSDSVMEVDSTVDIEPMSSTSTANDDIGEVIPRSSKKRKSNSTVDVEAVASTSTAHEDIGEVIPRSSKKKKTSSTVDIEAVASTSTAHEDIGEVIPRSSKARKSSLAVTSPVVTSSTSLSQTQTTLHQKITAAKTLEELQSIWDNFDISSATKIELTPLKIREIDKMFRDFGKQQKQIRKQHVQKDVQTTKVDEVRSKAKDLLIKHLKLDEPVTTPAQPVELKPVKTWYKLKLLYKTLYKMLKDAKSPKRHELKEVFHSRKDDVQLMVKNGEKSTARKLIFCTSKVFLAKYQIE